MAGPSNNTFPSSTAWPGAWPPVGGRTYVKAKPQVVTTVVVKPNRTSATIAPFATN